MKDIWKRKTISSAIERVVKDVGILQELLNNFQKEELEAGRYITKELAAEKERKLFAVRLRTLRQEAGMNQGELADKIGVERGIISRYETARAMPRRKAIEKIAAGLGVKTDALDIRKAYPK